MCEIGAGSSRPRVLPLRELEALAGAGLSRLLTLSGARIEGLAPGGYTLFASDSIEAGDWQDPAVLQRQESRGTAVTVKEGETRQITLRITS